MTTKAFWRDPYLTDLDTRITTVDGGDVCVAETVFFAESGGQESDSGTIGGHAVLAARRVGAEIVYSIGDGHGLDAGDAVRMAIDWERRYRLMRLHIAAEMVLELVTQAHGSVDKTGAHIAADKARIDFRWPGSIAPILPAIAAGAETLIAADKAIVTGFSDVAAERRFWRIDGFAQVPCGGTHVRRTAEVGAIALRRRNPGRGRERIEITLAAPAA